MSVAPLAQIQAQLDQARSDLTALRTALKEHLDKMASQPLLSDEEREALEEQAASGALGEEMKELVGKIQDGDDTWEAVFAGESPHGALLVPHLNSILDEHAEDIALAFEDILDEEEAKGNDLGI